MKTLFVIKTAYTHGYYTGKEDEKRLSQDIKDACKFNSIEEIEAKWEEDFLSLTDWRVKNFSDIWIIETILEV